MRTKAQTLAGRRWAAALAAPLLLVAAGCSQIDSLKVVAGDDLAGVEIAIGDVLHGKSVALKVVPVCKRDGKQFQCAGSTLDGKNVTAQTSGTDADELEIKIGSNTVFTGKVQQVLTESARTK